MKKSLQKNSRMYYYHWPCMRVTVRNSKISFFEYVNIQQEPSIWGSERETRTLYQAYIYILPRTSPFLGECTSKSGWQREKRGAVSSGSGRYRAAYSLTQKWQYYSGNTVVKRSSRVNKTLAMVVNDRRVINAWFIIGRSTLHDRSTQWRSWLRHCVTNRKGAGSIPDGVINIIHPVALWTWVCLRI